MKKRLKHVNLSRKFDDKLSDADRNVLEGVKFNRKRLKVENLYINDEDIIHFRSGGLLYSKSNIIISTVLVLSVFSVYYKCLAPTVVGGEAGEIISTVHFLGVMQSPGYPFLTMFAKLFSMIFPFGTIAWKVNLFCAICGSLTALPLYGIAIKFCCKCRAGAILSVACFVFNPIIWNYSVSASAFPCGNVCLAFLFYILMMFLEEHDYSTKYKLSILMALMLGFCLNHYHSSWFFGVASYAIVFVNIVYTKLICRSWLYSSAIALAIPLSFYLYLPFSSFLALSPCINGDVGNIQGLISHVLRFRYGAFEFFSDEGITFNFHIYYQHLLECYSYGGYILAILGICTIIIERRLVVSHVSLLLMLAIYVVFICVNPDSLPDHLIKQGYVRHLLTPADMIFVLFIGRGLSFMFRLLSRFPMTREVTSLSFSLLLVAGLLQKGINMGDQSKNSFLKDFSTSILLQLPTNSIVVGLDDAPINVAKYVHIVEGVRPDIQLVHSLTLRKSWALSIQKPFLPLVHFPGEAMSSNDCTNMKEPGHYNICEFLQENLKRLPIFSCSAMPTFDVIFQKTFQVFAFGPCTQILPIETPFENFTVYEDRWTHPYLEHSEAGGAYLQSWERMIQEEMWSAKISLPYDLYKKAEESKDKSIKETYYLKAYELYHRELSKVKSTGARYPPYWHRNLGLACERLLHTSSQLSRSLLCREAIDHFVTFMKLMPNCPDQERVLKAIRVLQNRLKNYQQLDEAERLTSHLQKDRPLGL